MSSKEVWFLTYAGMLIDWLFQNPRLILWEEGFLKKLIVSTLSCFWRINCLIFLYESSFPHKRTNTAIVYYRPQIASLICGTFSTRCWWPHASLSRKKFFNFLRFTCHLSLSIPIIDWVSSQGIRLPQGGMWNKFVNETSFEKLSINRIWNQNTIRINCSSVYSRIMHWNLVISVG